MNIKINYDLLKDCICMMDFYKNLDITKYFAKDKVSKVQQIKCNKCTLEKIYDVLLSNAKKSKDKRIKHYNEGHIVTIVNLDFVNYGPTEDNSVEDDVLLLEF